MSLKSQVFEKLSDAVESANPLTVDGVQILALSASAVKNLNEGTDVDEDVYTIGTVGEIGFGVATALREDYESIGAIPLDGHDNILSKNYGNYLHMKSGAILVHVPKCYFKINGNTFSYSSRAESGYVLERAFINAGVEKRGIFVSKYGATNNAGVLSSQAMKAPLSTNSANNPISALTGAPSNTYGGLYQAVKTMDAKAFLTPVYVYSMLARMSKAHGEASTSSSACAYRDVSPKMPKGNLNNALKDINDTSVTFISSGYSNCALTGSGSNFAKTTHNGQESGIADLNGNMWEVASGFIRTDANGFLMLKESVDIRNILNDSITAGTGAYDVALYDVVDISDTVFDNSGWTYLGNGTNQVFGFSTDRTNIAYKKTALGIPTPTGVSGAGTTEFGNDGLYRYLRNEMACLCGGNWSSTSIAGAFAMNLNYDRTNSGNSVGGRASLYAL